MYADTDFLVALMKDDDWLTDAAEKVYRENADRIWTSRYGLLELLLVSYRQNWNCTEVLSNVEELIEVKNGKDQIMKASVMVEKEGMTPMDAIHLVSSGEDKIVSSDQDYDKHTERLKIDEIAEEER